MILNTMKSTLPLALSLTPLFLAGCFNTTHEVKTEHEIKPIHITVDVNLKVNRELDDFFGDLDEQSTLIDYEEPPVDPAHSEL